MGFIDYQSESSWRAAQDHIDLEARRRDLEEMQDYEFPRMAAAKCDGSGVIEEFYFDVDQAQQIRCPGCFNCALQESVQAAEAAKDEPLPAWMQEDELERGCRRAPLYPEAA